MKISKTTVTSLKKELSKFEKSKTLSAAQQKKLKVTLRKVYKFASTNLNDSTNLRAKAGLESLKHMSLFAIDIVDDHEGKVNWVEIVIKIIILILEVLCSHFC